MCVTIGYTEINVMMTSRTAKNLPIGPRLRDYTTIQPEVQRRPTHQTERHISAVRRFLIRHRFESEVRGRRPAGDRDFLRLSAHVLLPRGQRVLSRWHVLDRICPVRSGRT